ncbi:hypothetical protein LSH36_69g07008 [Paralvinella palmiformis]|uniref:Uncharacterized protein n=1 Tax=Paralvinella palmiformis TaxID=53620 RepID=A0AAD9K395_9ANNE|nr:hypothetical protein LSH36_69g07008 [Paralvinella palmiformis]
MIAVGDNISMSTFTSDVTPEGSNFTSSDIVSSSTPTIDDSNIMTSLIENLLNKSVNRTIGEEDKAGSMQRANDVLDKLMTATTHAPTDATTSSGPRTSSFPVSNYVIPTHRLESTLTGWITDSHNLSGLHGNYNLYVLYGTFGLMLLCFLLLVFWIQCKKRLMLLRYERLPVTAADQRDTNFVYKPSNGDLLDEEYENTFVGVSIPILQDVTKL